MSDPEPVRHARGILDTSVLIDIEDADTSAMPLESVTTALSLAELSAGPHATADPNERANRQQRLQWVEDTFDPLPFDSAAARAYGRIYAAIGHAGRSPRSRAIDLLIAAVAVANDLPLFTRNAADFGGLEELLDVIAV